MADGRGDGIALRSAGPRDGRTAALQRIGEEHGEERHVPACGRDPALHYRVWAAGGRPRGAVVVVPGAGAHAALYAPLAAALAACGFTSACVDLRGHGESGGRRGDVRVFQDYAVDVRRVLADWRPAAPLTVLGESMGALVALEVALGEGVGLTGLVLLSPAFALARPVPAWLQALGQLAAVVLPTAPAPLLGRLEGAFGGATAPAGGLEAADEGAVDGERARSAGGDRTEAFNVDWAALVSTLNDRFTLRWGLGVLSAGRRLARAAARLNVPSLWLLGDADAVVDATVARRAFQAVGCADKTLRVFRGFPHVLFSGPDPDRVLEVLTDWLEERAGEGSEVG